ncbi:hypothetical protein [Flavobacterium sp.]|uniref:hypothetical protein n=1 Tax=Flavobacterium sp. TaxID=239 RepID=UPI0022BB67C2|nr:hypothetical protein [Flavobacterium sp.]MCZ8145838.1 hypothetical protein [Flavobacterium sp.]MCZ8366424.1 hypothetical protein [Flavobacterium sp.]
MFTTEKIKKFQAFLNQDPHNRFNSWKHCYMAFENQNLEADYLALHLGFYLASWGMYRGSTGLLQKDYKIHVEAVQLIKKYYHLRCTSTFEVNKQHIEDILNLKQQLYEYYNSFTYQNKEAYKAKPPTDTLLSKIILGTLGCTPAFDRYFNEGIKQHHHKAYKFDKKAMFALFSFIEQHYQDLIELQTYLARLEGVHYPLFKLIDMYFWNEGYTMSQTKDI